MKSDTVVSFVVVMLILQVIATALLWVLNVLSDETTSVFAVLLAADVLAFAVVLQVYRNPGAKAEAKSETPAPTAAPAAQPPTTPFKEGQKS